jgi:hypothetical protein
MRGNYTATLDRWLSRFPESQLFVGFYDEIVANPARLLKRILGFLGVSDDESRIPSDVKARVNPGTGARIPPKLHRFLCSIYVDQIRMLAKRFDTYPRSWLEKCETILTAPEADQDDTPC